MAVRYKPPTKQVEVKSIQPPRWVDNYAAALGNPASAPPGSTPIDPAGKQSMPLDPPVQNYKSYGEWSDAFGKAKDADLAEYNKWVERERSRTPELGWRDRNIDDWGVREQKEAINERRRREQREGERFFATPNPLSGYGERLMDRQQARIRTLGLGEQRERMKADPSSKDAPYQDEWKGWEKHGIYPGVGMGGFINALKQGFINRKPSTIFWGEGEEYY